MWDLAAALIAAALGGFTLGWWLARRQRAGRFVYLEWRTDAARCPRDPPDEEPG